MLLNSIVAGNYAENCKDAKQSNQHQVNVPKGMKVQTAIYRYGFSQRLIPFLNIKFQLSKSKLLTLKIPEPEDQQITIGFCEAVERRKNWKHGRDAVKIDIVDMEIQ